MERFNAKKPLYPLLGVLISIVTLIFGLIIAKHDSVFYFFIGLWCLFIAFGYWRSCILVLPIAIILSAIFGGITYAIAYNIDNTLSAVSRSITICLAVIPGLSVSNVLFIRNLKQLKVPKTITLGMMIAINFFPLLGREMRQIRQSMRTRGVGSILNFKIFYRAFLIPLVVRIVNISDTLALSVETRGFTLDKGTSSIYNPVKIEIKDFVFALIFIVMVILTVVM